MRRFGEEHGFPVLPWPAFRSDPELVAEARVVAASGLDAEGLWTDATDGLRLHFALHDLAPTRRLFG